MPQRHGDTEKERSREAEKERSREGETKRCERAFSPSFRLSFSLSLCLSVPLALWLCGSVAGQTGSFEKQAISSAQEMSASNLDEALPNRPFASWFIELIGPKAGVV